MTQKPFATQKLRPTDPIYIYTETLLHTNPFTLKHFYTQKLLHTHTHPFAHTLLHTNTFTHRPSYTQTETFTQTLLHTDTLTQKPFDTQKLRHTDPIYTQTLLHTNAYTLTLTPFYIQHQLNRNFTSVFAHRPSFRAKGLLQDKSGTSKIAILHQFLRIDPHFVRKGCSRTSPAQVKSHFFFSFCASTLISCERVAPGQVKSHFFFSFCASTLISCERVAPDTLKSQFFLSF